MVFIKKTHGNVNWHLLCIHFLITLAQKCGHSLSHNFHAEVQTHQWPLSWSWHLFPTYRRWDIHGVFSPCTHIWYGVCAHEKPMCVYRLYLAHQVWFSTRAPGQSLTTANQWRTSTQIFSPSSVEDPCSQKLVLILMNGLRKAGQRAHDRN